MDCYYRLKSQNSSLDKQIFITIIAQSIGYRYVIEAYYHSKKEKGGTMKKLFAIAIAASLISGGLYAFSFGLGAAYDQIGVDSLYGDPHLAIKADVMCKPLPILGFRIDLVDVAMKSDDWGGTQFTIATGCGAALIVYIPMAGMIQPYIPFYFMYSDQGDAGPSAMHFFGGVGGEFMLGSLNAYLEGRFDWSDVGDFMDVDPDAQNWFTIQGGVRLPINM